MARPGGYCAALREHYVANVDSAHSYTVGLHLFSVLYLVTQRFVQTRVDRV